MYPQIAQIFQSNNLRGVPEVFTGNPSLKKLRKAFFKTLIHPDMVVEYLVLVMVCGANLPGNVILVNNRPNLYFYSLISTAVNNGLPTGSLIWYRTRAAVLFPNLGFTAAF